MPTIGGIVVDRSIPLSRLRNCTYCSVQVDSNGVGVYQLASGWLMNRRAGGANTITIPLRQDHYACADCIDKLKHGIPVGQMRLFGLTTDDG
jgi:hypothetical protein